MGSIYSKLLSVESRKRRIRNAIVNIYVLIKLPWKDMRLLEKKLRKELHDIIIAAKPGGLADIHEEVEFCMRHVVHVYPTLKLRLKFIVENTLNTIRPPPPLPPTLHTVISRPIMEGSPSYTKLPELNTTTTTTTTTTTMMEHPQNGPQFALHTRQVMDSPSCTVRLQRLRSLSTGSASLPSARASDFGSDDESDYGFCDLSMHGEVLFIAHTKNSDEFIFHKM